MRYLFQRIVNNDSGWIKPTPGRLYSKADKGYLQAHGFGHEDWNFSSDKDDHGDVAAYMYYKPGDPKGPFNIVFAIYERGVGWSVAGFYQSARYEQQGADFPESVLRRRAEELAELGRLGSLGGKYRGLTIRQLAGRLLSESADYHWRVAPRNVRRLAAPIRLPNDITDRYGKYFARPTEMTEAEWDGILSVASHSLDKPAQDDYADGGETEFPEGRLIEAKHKTRERNKTLVQKAKKAFVAKHGKLFCEACGFDFKAAYGYAGEDFIEVHHMIPVSSLAENAKTKVDDLAMVCSNCHRMLHRRRPWMSIGDLRDLLQAMRRSAED